MLTVIAALTISCDAPDWMVFAPFWAALVFTAGAVATALLPRRHDAPVGDFRTTDVIASVLIGLASMLPVAVLLFAVIAVASLSRCSA